MSKRAIVLCALAIVAISSVLWIIKSGTSSFGIVVMLGSMLAGFVVCWEPEQDLVGRATTRPAIRWVEPAMVEKASTFLSEVCPQGEMLQQMLVRYAEFMEEILTELRDLHRQELKLVGAGSDGLCDLVTRSALLERQLSMLSSRFGQLNDELGRLSEAGVLLSPEPLGNLDELLDWVRACEKV